jgi:excinuclease ABC subunit C
MIDGGKGQLSAALKAMQEFSEFSDMPVVAIAKSRVVADALATNIEKSSERIFLPNKEDPIELVEGTPAFRLFVRIRDETHRFAIGFHRKRVRAGFTQSLLDSVPGIGPALKKRLLNHFRDMEGICAASLEDLCAVPGLSEKIAIRLYSSTHADE